MIARSWLTRGTASTSRRSENQIPDSLGGGALRATLNLPFMRTHVDGVVVCSVSHQRCERTLTGLLFGRRVSPARREFKW